MTIVHLNTPSHEKFQTKHHRTQLTKQILNGTVKIVKDKSVPQSIKKK